MRASVYIATSLDGFIARPNGAIDWLTGADSAPHGDDYGYQAFMETVDTMVMGRHTFDLAVTFAAWPYRGKRVVVLSRTPPAIPQPLADEVSWLALPPQQVVERLAAQGATHLYIDGGKTIQGFLQAELIDELIITRLPILIGAGIPLFGPIPRDIHLKHNETRQFENGFVQSRYTIIHTAAAQG